MQDINIVSLTGNLTRDPELRATKSGSKVLSFGIACNASRKNPQTGDWEDYANFIDCTMFGARAEALSKIMGKGTKVAISGELRYTSWEKDGQRRSKVEVKADQVVLMSRGKQQESVLDNGESPDVYDYDLPF